MDVLAAALFDHDDVLDADAEAPRDVDARLRRDDRARGQRLAPRRARAGRFVDLDADAMSEGVGEVFAVARVRDDLRRRVVDGAAGDARPRRGDAGALGVEHGAVDPLHLLARVPDGDGARHVGAVAAVDAAEVHRDELARRNGLVRRHGVGPAAVRAGGDDGVEGRVLRAIAEHEVRQLRGELLLRDAHANVVIDLRERALRDALRAHERLQLLRVLDRAERREQRGRGAELGAYPAPVTLQLRDGHILVLKADGPDAVALDRAVEQRGVAALRRRQLHRRVRDLLRRRLDVARVRPVVRPLPRYERDAVGSGRAEAGGVEAVRRVREQHRIDAAGVQPVPYRRKVVHGVTPPPCSLLSSCDIRCAGSNRSRCSRRARS